MDLPLNSIHSDDSRGEVRPEASDTVADDSRDLAGATPLTRSVVTPLPSPAMPSPGTGDSAGASAAFSEWAFVWRRPTRAGRIIGIDPLRLIVIAALTSAVVSLLTIWASGGAQVSVPGNEWVPVVTVSYEPLEPASPVQPLAAARPPAAITETAYAAEHALEGNAAGVDTAGTSATDRDSTGLRGPSGRPPSSFTVTSQPEGAQVTVNGVGYGVTPLTIRFLPPGAKRIRATKPGYQSEERFLGDDAARSTSRLRIVLREMPGGSGPP